MSELIVIIVVAFLFTSLFTSFILWLAFRNPPPARWLEDDELLDYKDYPTRENHRNRPWH